MENRKTCSPRDTGGSGDFSFSNLAPGNYQLVITNRYFCQVELFVKLNKRGWSAVKVAIPTAATDRHVGYCDEELKIGPLEDTAQRTE